MYTYYYTQYILHENENK